MQLNAVPLFQGRRMEFRVTLTFPTGMKTINRVHTSNAVEAIRLASVEVTEDAKESGVEIAPPIGAVASPYKSKGKRTRFLAPKTPEQIAAEKLARESAQSKQPVSGQPKSGQPAGKK
jgi:hypothetical protein